MFRSTVAVGIAEDFFVPYAAIDTIGSVLIGHQQITHYLQYI
jgi:hypothetical protein